MPIYEYECNACGDRHEFIQKFSDGPKRKCPSCGKSRLKKLVSAAAFHLKGDGWYVTDFRDKDGKKKPEDGASDTKGEGKAESSSDASADSKSASGEGGESGKTDKKADKKADKKKPAAKKTKAA